MAGDQLAHVIARHAPTSIGEERRLPPSYWVGAAILVPLIGLAAAWWAFAPDRKREPCSGPASASSMSHMCHRDQGNGSAEVLVSSNSA